MGCAVFQGQYWTIHITPEPEFAYVSFETNVPLDNYKELFQRVVDVFKPGRTSLTIFANKVSKYLVIRWVDTW